MFHVESQIDQKDVLSNFLMFEIEEKIISIEHFDSQLMEILEIDESKICLKWNQISKCSSNEFCLQRWWFCEMPFGGFKRSR